MARPSVCTRGVKCKEMYRNILTGSRLLCQPVQPSRTLAFSRRRFFVGDTVSADRESLAVMDWMGAPSFGVCDPHEHEHSGSKENGSRLLGGDEVIRELANTGPELYCTHTLEGQFLSVDPLPASILGYTVQEMIGTPMREFLAPEFRPYFDEYLVAVQRDGVARGLMSVMTRTGQRRTWKYRNTLQTQGLSSPVVMGVAHDITGYKQAENSFSLLRMLVEQSNDAIEIIDPETLCFLDVNEKACMDLGYTREEMLSMRVTDIDTAVEGPLYSQIRTALQSEGHYLTEGFHRRKDGTSMPVEVNIKRVKFGRYYIIAIVRDISKRRKTQQALQESEKRLKMLLEINNALVTRLERNDLLPAISAALYPVFRQDFAGTSLYEPETATMRIHALDPGLGDGLVGTATSVEQSWAGQALMSNAIISFDRSDLERRDTPLSHYLIAHGIQCLCFVPLRSAKGPIGALAIGSRVPGAFRDVDHDLMRQVAVQIAIALDNTLAYGQIEQLKDKLHEEKIYLEDELRTERQFDEIVGDSPALREVLRLATKVAPSDATVLLLGETGTGKELVARAIHRLGTRRNRAFVKMNCAAVPTGLLESELFGHEKGAFTSAVSKKMGRLELADQATLFLDEVGEMPLELQPKLLRVLQDQEFERLGSTKTIRVNIRLVAATNRDLSKSVLDGRFRSDLFYRLNVFPIRLPPLRERRTDIPKLVSYFVDKHARHMGKNIETVPAATFAALMEWHWPGNIRELENFIERSVILTPGDVLQVPLSEIQIGPRPVMAQSLGEAAEREQIVRVLRESRGLIAGPNGAAARLGMKRTTLQSKLQRLGINPDDFRPGAVLNDLRHERRIQQ